MAHAVYETLQVFVVAYGSKAAEIVVIPDAAKGVGMTEFCIAGETYQTGETCKISLNFWNGTIIKHFFCCFVFILHSF